MKRPNIVLLVIDCLRTDRLNCYGASHSAAPTLDSLAEQGVVFEQAVAMGFHTLTTMPSVLSGCYPSACGGFVKLTAERPRLPAILQSMGYRTAAFISNPYLGKARGYHPGFDDFDECAPDLTPSSTSARGWLIRGFNRLVRHWGAGIECPPYLNAEALTERALRWLAHAPEPFFLWVHYMDAHTPYNVQNCALLLPGGRGQRPYPYGFWKHLRLETESVTPDELVLAQQIYDAGVRKVDAQIARLVETLRETGRWEETILVLAADHGEEFIEHTAFGHSKSLYEPIVHIPLIISLPKTEPRRISAQMRQIDLAPTLIDLAGGDIPPAMQGISLAPWLHGQSPSDLPAISQTNPSKNWLVSLRQPPWKLIWGVEPDTLESRSVELYHLESDPGEQVNLAEQHPERTKDMLAMLRQHIASLDLRTVTEHPPEEIDPEVLRRLQALGYLDEKDK